MRSFTSLGKLFLLNLVILVLFLVVVEGLASHLLFLWTTVIAVREQPWDPAIHDPELGWVTGPNRYHPDAYGPGVYIQTNGQGFRNNKDFPRAVAPGIRRIICSGDSYTFGYGVDNESTFCHLLSSLDGRLEAVNMGQGAYGLDQAYLRYRRDGAALDHHVHLLAFITDDFRRMRLDTFFGYRKPRLELEQDQLVVRNVPIPARSSRARWLITLLPHLRTLRTTELLTKTTQKLQSGKFSSETPSSWATPENTGQLMFQVIREAKAVTLRRASKLVLVYLPMPGDYDPSDASQAWEAFVEGTAVELDIPLVNVIAEHRRLSPKGAARLFGPHHHFSVEGHDYVAKLIYRTLTSVPGLLDGQSGQ